MPAPTDYTQMSKKEILFSFSLVTSLFFLWGFSYGLLDVLNSHFYTIFELTKTQTTLLQFAYFISYLLVAPPMGIFMRKYGYKPGIHIGLGLFSFGAVMFWPSAVYEQYGMFIAFIFCCGSGLATLEVAASSYIALLGDPKYSAFRLTLAQSFNGIASVIGPLLASHTFFKGANAYSLGTVQYVYLAMSVFGCMINIAVYFAKLPEVRQVVSVGAVEAMSWKGMLKKKHTMWGALAEFAYVGSQVSLASFAIFYFTEHPGISPPISKSLASSMFSGCQAAFTIGRFLGVFYLRFIDPAFALFVSGVGLIIFCILTSMLDGVAGIVCLFITFFFEAICYPVILSLALTDLGSYAKFGAGIVTAAVSGGAVWPSMQGAVADAVSSQRSYFISLLGFVPLMSYGFGMWYVQCRDLRGHWSIWTYHPKLAIKTQPDGTDEIVEGSEDMEDSKNASKTDIVHAEKA